MAEKWEIAPYALNREGTKWMYLLRKLGKASFMDDCLRRDPQRAARIAITAARVFDNGIEWALESGTVKQLRGTQGNLSVFETRIKGQVIRVATYLHLGKIPIYLFDFTTHGGSGNNLSNHDRERAEQMAYRAAACTKSFDFAGEEEKRK